MANRISGINVIQKKQTFIFQKPGSDSLGGGCPIFYLEVTVSTALIRKAGVGTPQFKAQSYVRYLSPGRPEGCMS